MSDLLTRPGDTGAKSSVVEDCAFSPNMLAGTVAHDLGVVVAPTRGRFRPAVQHGLVRAGTLLGHITGGRGRADEVRVPVDADIRDLLVRPGQLVTAGQGLVWLQHMGKTA